MACQAPIASSNVLLHSSAKARLRSARRRKAGLKPRILQAFAIERNRVGGSPGKGQLVGIFEQELHPPAWGLPEGVLEQPDGLLIAVAGGGRAGLLDQCFRRLRQGRVHRKERQRHDNTGDPKRPGSPEEKHLAASLESMEKSGRQLRWLTAWPRRKEAAAACFRPLVGRLWHCCRRVFVHPVLRAC
jgi:hypothetical protein